MISHEHIPLLSFKSCQESNICVFPPIINASRLFCPFNEQWECIVFLGFYSLLSVAFCPFGWSTYEVCWLRAYTKRLSLILFLRECTFDGEGMVLYTVKFVIHLLKRKLKWKRNINFSNWGAYIISKNRTHKIFLVPPQHKQKKKTYLYEETTLIYQIRVIFTKRNRVRINFYKH